MPGLPAAAGPGPESDSDRDPARPLALAAAAGRRARAQPRRGRGRAAQLKFKLGVCSLSLAGEPQAERPRRPESPGRQLSARRTERRAAVGPGRGRARRGTAVTAEPGRLRLSLGPARPG